MVSFKATIQVGFKDLLLFSSLHTICGCICWALHVSVDHRQEIFLPATLNNRLHLLLSGPLHQKVNLQYCTPRLLRSGNLIGRLGRPILTPLLSLPYPLHTMIRSPKLNNTPLPCTLPSSYLSTDSLSLTATLPILVPPSVSLITHIVPVSYPLHMISP